MNLLFEVFKDVLRLVWLIVTWPFVMAGYAIGVAFMSVLVRLGLWEMPTYGNKGHLRKRKGKQR